MSRLGRIFRIYHTIGRYRLDTLLNAKNTAFKHRLLLLPLRLYPMPKENRGKRLRHALEELGPIFVKFGQLLSTRPDLIPADIVEELNHLQDNVAPFDNSTFKQLVESALGAEVGELFQHFDETPLASASVAQVHAAQLHNGDDVIIKVIRPNIAPIISRDTAILHLVARLVERISSEGRRLRPVEVVEDYRNTIFDELNLSLEAANASQLRRNFENNTALYVPKVYWDYSRNNVMVMERIYGIPVTHMDALNEQGTDLKLLAERGVEIFFTQVFEHNFFHADMHPGNVFVSRNTPNDPTYIAVDMAIIGSLTREDQYYLARNLLAMFRRDYRQVAELHVSSGWVPKGTSVSGFEAAIRAVCEPIFEKPLKDISFGEALITIFRTAQRYNMPVQPQLVLLQKTLLNIEGLGRQLYPELNLWDTAHPFLERWIKQRYHPRTLWKEFRYYAPEWLEKLPELPQLVVSALEAQESLKNNENTSTQGNKTTPNLRRTGTKICALGIGAMGVAITPTMHTLAFESIAVFSSALLLLLLS